MKCVLPNGMTFCFYAGPPDDVRGTQVAWSTLYRFCMSDSRVSGLDALPECSLQGWGQGLAIGRNTYGVEIGAQRCQEVINKITTRFRVRHQASEKLTVLKHAEGFKRSRSKRYRASMAEGIQGIGEVYLER